MALAMALALSACGGIKQTAGHGYVESAPIGDQIAMGETTKDDVHRMLGSPSTVSAFPPETWYYISRNRETVAFLEPELTSQKITRIEFDVDGRVAGFDVLDETASRDVNYVERETPTEGRSLGLMEQLLGNLGKFNTPRDASKSRH